MKFADVKVAVEPSVLTEAEFNRKLALESSVTNNVIDFFREGISSLVHKLKGYVSAFAQVKEVPTMDDMERNLLDTSKNKLETRYLTHKDLLVQIPEGFKGEFLPFAKELNAIGKTLIGDTHTLFSEYQRALSSFLSDPSALGSLKDLSGSYAKFAASRAGMEERISIFYTPTTLSRQRLGDTLPRLADGEHLIRELKELGRVIDYKEIKKIEGMIQASSHYLEILEKKIQNKETSEVSSQAVKAIAAGTYEIARYVDQVVVYYYAGLSLIGCSKLLFEELKKLK